jgi:hypothetical protein
MNLVSGFKEMFKELDLVPFSRKIHKITHRLRLMSSPEVLIKCKDERFLRFYCSWGWEGSRAPVSPYTFLK